MLVITILAALTALPAVQAASKSTSTTASTSTRCTTRFGFYPLPTGTAAVPTWYSFTATTVTYQVSVTTQDTVFVTPDATTFTNVVTTSTVTTTTSMSTPPASTKPAPPGFLPLLVIGTPVAPTGSVSRVRRLELEGRADVAHSLKRQTAEGNTGGFIAYPNGTYSSLYRRHPHRVDCRVAVTYEETETTVVQGPPVTRIAQQQTLTAVSTITQTSTSTVTVVAPMETKYAACASNNVVNTVTDAEGNRLVFDRVIYLPQEGFPVTNELVVDTVNPTACCVACQNTPYCAGSFYATGIEECHLRLTQPFTPNTPPLLPSGSGLPAGNGSLPTGTGTGAPYPISTGTPPSNGTCNAGSMSLYVGTIRGRRNFDPSLALYFSNGPCGRFSVSPIPLRPEEVQSKKKRGIAAM